MVKGLYTAHTGMVNEMKRMDVLANNLANSDTYGFKKEGTTSHSFKNELAIKIKDTSNYGLHKNLGSMTYGVHLGETYTDWDEGSFKVTDNADGYLVTADGDHVLNATGALSGDGGEANWVKVDPNEKFSVNSLGYITQNNQLVGTIGVVDVDNYDYIEKYGENLYNLTAGGNIIASDAEIEQGALETSNVNVVNEMVNMITIQRAYEAGQKVITSIDETLDKAVNNVGRV